MDGSANVTKRDVGSVLQKRNKELPPWCNPPGIGQASEQATYNNYKYLNGLYGTRCGVNAGPRVCSRIACTLGGGVFLCNDVSWSQRSFEVCLPRLTGMQNNYFIEPDCGYLSTYVGDICNSCYGDCTGFGNYNAGQLFDTDNYNIIVSAQNC